MPRSSSGGDGVGGAATAAAAAAAPPPPAEARGPGPYHRNNDRQQHEGQAEQDSYPGHRRTSSDSLTRGWAEELTKYDAEHQIYIQRWLMLGLLSWLSALTVWKCYAFTAIPPEVQSTFHGQHLNGLVSLFLVASLVSSIVEPFLVVRLSLRHGVMLGSVLMTIGSLLRSGLPFLLQADFTAIQIGTALVGASQPYFQGMCSSCQVVLAWFPPHERRLATAITHTAPVVGLLLASLVGINGVTTAEHLSPYLMLLSSLTSVSAVSAILLFEDAPPSLAPSRPPSTPQEHMRLLNHGDNGSSISAAASSTGALVDETRASSSHLEYPAPLQPLPRQALSLVKVLPVLGRCLVAFVACEAVFTTMVVFFTALLQPLGFSLFFMSLSSSLFLLAVAVSSLVAGFLPRRPRPLNRIVQVCFLACGLSLGGMALASFNRRAPLLALLFLGLGLAVGPIEPFVGRLAMDVTLPPVEDKAVLWTLQLIGKGGSAAALPLFYMCQRPGPFTYAPALLFLAVVSLVGVLAMAAWKSHYYRRVSAHHREEDDVEEAPVGYLDMDPQEGYLDQHQDRQEDKSEASGGEVKQPSPPRPCACAVDSPGALGGEGVASTEMRVKE